MGGRSFLERVHRWLSVGEPARKCDAIFVLAGARARKAYALELYRQDYAPLIVLSVARFEIRRMPELSLPYPEGSVRIDLLAAAQSIPPAQRHFFVAFDAAGVHFEKTPVGPFGTLAEMQTLARWCERRPEIASLLVVSSGYHLRRVRMCCHALLPKKVRCVFVQTPEERRPPAALLALEAVKLAAYRLMLWLKM